MKKLLNKIKLFIIFWTRIVFVKSRFKVSLYKKIKSNFWGGYLADQYILYNFDKNRKQDFLSEFDWYKSRIINEPFNEMLNNKIICNEIIKPYIDTPAIYYVKVDNNITSFSDLKCNYESILEKIKKEQALIFKPINAGQGKKVYLFSYEKSQFKKDNVIISKHELINFMKNNDNWFLSKRIEQAQYLNNIYNKTFNTIRLIVLKFPNEKKFKIFFAVQRIGTNQTIPVDNGSRGGLVSKINLETGVLSEAKSLHTLKVYYEHPNSKTKIKGVVIPNWENIKEKILNVSNQFPYLHFIAWDLLITDNNVVVIEANTSSGVNIIQLWGGQKNKELGKFYKAYKIIK